MGEMPIESFIGLPINDSNGKKIGSITSVDLDNDLWYGEVKYDIFKEEGEVTMAIDNLQKQKEEIIKQVKLLGQELIDRAEDIVGDNNIRTSLDIILTFTHDSPPELEYRSTHLSRRFIDDIMDIPLTVGQSGIPLNAIRENLGFESIENHHIKWNYISEVGLPSKIYHDWLLVKTDFDSGNSLPHIAELRDNKWYSQDIECGPLEEVLGCKVIAWADMQLIK